MVKKAKRPERMWVWREKYFKQELNNNVYIVTAGRKPRVHVNCYKADEGQQARSREVCCALWEAATPASLHLPPGGGPKEIKIVEVRAKK